MEFFPIMFSYTCPSAICSWGPLSLMLWKTPTEANYDVAKRELPSIKEALEKWHHWLEGVKHPFHVIVDHRKLKYPKSGKRLNPHQARWALFFSRFQFTVTDQPGTKNSKADALLCYYTTPQTYPAPCNCYRPCMLEHHAGNPKDSTVTSASSWVPSQYTIIAYEPGSWSSEYRRPAVWATQEFSRPLLLSRMPSGGLQWFETSKLKSRPAKSQPSQNPPNNYPLL